METHQKLLRNLRGEMRTRYVAVNQRTNPIGRDVAMLETGQLLHVVVQYAIFPANIIGFLSAARDSAELAGWEGVVGELERNIGEERGSRSDLVGAQFKDVTHYDILVSGLAQTLGANLGYTPASDLEESLRTTAAAPAMATFVKTIESEVGNVNSAYSVGAAYALESSAVPELVIVRNIVNELCTRVNGTAMGEEGYLRRFFDIHLKDWEPGHEAGLRETTQIAITSTELQQAFASGFHAVMKTEDALWNGLYQEIRQPELLSKYAL